MPRVFLAFVVFAAQSAAQDRGLAPLVRGIFQEWLGSEGSGTFLFHTTDAQEYRCLYSNKTYFESDHRRTFITDIAPGQQLEILSERIAEPPRCRALIVRVVAGEKPAPANRARIRPAPAPTEFFAPRGSLTFTGLIVRMDENSLVLRTRAGERQTIRLRPDTRYSGSGDSGAGLAPLNRPVQIRAGRNFESEIEAFSVVWGDILRP
ncbi:MAG TPA: hypothetical protein VM120_25445 [Bryobacteraceae bacterium]|nr:hypothetical protein [Bryobacteraceae bacterium]